MVAFAVTVVVTAAAAPVADEAPTKVRLNKINLLLRCSVSPSSSTSPPSHHPHICARSPPSPLPPRASLRHPPDLCFSDPHPPTASRLRLLLYYAAIAPADPDSSSCGVLASTSSPPGSRLGAPSSSPSDGNNLILRSLGACFITGSVVPPSTDAWRGLPPGCMRLRRLYDPHRRIRRRQRLRCSCRAYPVFGPRCNLVFLGGPLCKMAA